MSQTNQGRAFPPAQFILGGTSALSATADAGGTFISENFNGGPAGCYAQDGETTKLVDPASQETVYTIDPATCKIVCIPPPNMGGRSTMAGLLDKATPQTSW